MAPAPEAVLSRSLDAFLARLRRHLGRSAGDPVAPPPAIDPRLLELAPAGADTVELFVARAGEVGTRVHRVAPDEVADTLAARCAAHGVRRAAVGIAGDHPRAAAVADALRRAGVTAVDWQRAGSFEPLFDADAGITDVAAAVATSGSLVWPSGPSRGRGLAIVPAVHVAIVEREQVLRELADLDSLASPEPPPAATLLVTGPSKTADIEGVLVTGVHGPGVVEVLLVDGGAGGRSPPRPV